MKLVLRNASIVCPDSSHHGKQCDILIENGMLARIAPEIATDAPEVKHTNLHVSGGWIDTSVSFGEPGFEERGTLANGLEAAAAGGFTAVCVQPDTLPVRDSQAMVAMARAAGSDKPTQIFPIAALTRKMEGQDLAELFDMHQAGAVAFGDYNRNIDNSNLMKIALQYSQQFGGTVIAYSSDRNITGKGIAHEGEVATRLGLKGIPPLAEELMIARNLFLLEYTGGRLHIPTISTAKSAQLIAEAKRKGLHVTCSVAVNNLVLTDESLTNFDTRFKLNPPLRDEATREALIQAVQDGTIDVITSDHRPMDIERKRVEFDMAEDGSVGLESAFGALQTVLPLTTVIEKLTAGYRVFNHQIPKIEEGMPANLTLFDPTEVYTFTEANLVSACRNAALINREMKGRVLGTIRNYYHHFTF